MFESTYIYALTDTVQMIEEQKGSLDFSFEIKKTIKIQLFIKLIQLAALLN